ncbi:MAG: prephenate dehydrogenase/arogenate dehydrogenase family protein [Mariprofundaceae bacterium]
MTDGVLVRRLAVIGVGLIGGSLALALRRAGAVAHVIGAGRDAAHLAHARSLGVIDEGTTDIAAAVDGADMVLLAVPMGAYAGVLGAMAGALAPDAIVTDAGSTKRYAIEAARAHLPDAARFVPGHPIAGSEHSGVAAARPDLFRSRLCLLTPTAETGEAALARVEAMWTAVGAHVQRMDADEHDRVLAAVSHLPHLAAYALVNAVLRLRRDDLDPLDFAAGGFRDFTRIASSSPEMWRDICLTNRDALAGQLDALLEELGALRAALADEDGEALLAHFAAAKAARDAWLKEKA